jgi:hypothetical protein
MTVNIDDFLTVMHGASFFDSNRVSGFLVQET